MKATPQEKGLALIDRAKACFVAEQPPSELELRRLKRDIEEQIGALPSDGNAYGAMLIVNVLERNADAVRATYTRGLALAGAHPVFVKNASSAFLHTGNPAEAWRIVSEGIRRFRGDRPLLENAINIAFLSGRVRATAEAILAYKAAGGETVPQLESTKKLVQFVEQHHISDDQAASVLSPMIVAMAKVTYRPGDGEQSVILYEKTTHGYDRAVVRYRTFVPAERVVDVLIDYADMVAESAPPEVLEILGADLAADRFRRELRAA